ncbi:hypothetical protein RKD33_007695 [Streptomyces sp. SAI-129]
MALGRHAPPSGLTCRTVSVRPPAERAATRRSPLRIARRPPGLPDAPRRRSSCRGDETRRRGGQDPDEAVVGVLARCRRQQAEETVLVGVDQPDLTAPAIGLLRRSGDVGELLVEALHPDVAEPGPVAAQHPHGARVGHGADVLAGRTDGQVSGWPSPSVSRPTVRRPTGHPPPRSRARRGSPGSSTAPARARARTGRRARRVVPDDEVVLSRAVPVAGDDGRAARRLPQWSRAVRARTVLRSPSRRP